MTTAYIGKSRRRGPRVGTYVAFAVALALLMAGGIVVLKHFHIGVPKRHDVTVDAPSCDKTFGRSAGASGGSASTTAKTGTTAATTTTADAAIAALTSTATPAGAQACVTLRLRWDGNQAVVTDAAVATPEMQTNAIPTGEKYRGNGCVDGALRAPRPTELQGDFCYAFFIPVGTALKLDTGLIGYSILRRHGYGSYEFTPLGIVASRAYSFAGMTAVAANTTGTVQVMTVNGVIRLVFHTAGNHRFNLSPAPGRAGHVVVLRYFLVPGLAAAKTTAGTPAATPTDGTVTPATSSGSTATGSASGTIGQQPQTSTPPAPAGTSTSVIPKLK